MHDPAIVGQAVAVMRHMRALRQLLLANGPDPVDDQERSGLTGPQVALLTELVRAGPGMLTLTQLAAQLHLSHSTTSGIVDRLEARAFVTRERDPHDGRVTRVAITDSVAAYAGRIGNSPYGELVTALERATPAQRESVLTGLETLLALMTP